jgi:DNA-binding transcriptional LysR family regulator
MLLKMKNQPFNPLSSRVLQMRLRDLLLLEQIAHLGSLRKVADALHLTQPAITQSLKGLEQAFGIALVERGRSGASLTPAGEAALNRIRAASEELHEAQRVALQSATPSLRVGSSPAAMLNLVPHALAALRKKAPHIKIVLTELGVALLWQRLDEGLLDAIVTRLPNLSQSKVLPEGLSFTKIGKEKMVLACARTHPAASLRRVDANALASYNWAMPPTDALAVLMLNEWFSQAGVRAPTPMVTCGSFYASLQTVARSDLITIVPESAALSLKTSLNLKIIPWNQGYLDIVFACRAASLKNPAIDVMRSCFDAPLSPPSNKP